MKNLLYGAAYYDEYMPYERVETDMEMMERAGMNVIRIAESTWSTWEKKEGEFDFTSLHRVLDAAKRHNISVIVGTPTYAVPTWLVKKDPTILAVTHNGQELYGHRQNMDITNPTYLKYAERMIRRLMEEVKDEPHVIGYQLDNETKAYDTCTPGAQALFVERLKSRWPDIEEFNHEFGLDYWSNRVDDWDCFPDIRGTINGSLSAEYKAFQRDLVTDFLAWQESIVRDYLRDDQFITHNFDFDWDMKDGGFGLQPDVDQFKAANHVTVAGCDIYHPSAQDLTGAEITCLGNIARGLKRDNYVVLETEAQGNLGWLPYPGQLRLCAYSHVANGANMVEYWHWHSLHNAIESYWKGVLSHNLNENDTYHECAVVGREWKRISSHVVNLKKINKVAVVADNHALTGISEFPMGPAGSADDHGYNKTLRWLCDSLFRLNVEYDIIPADPALLAKYDYVIVPALYSVKERFLLALDGFVEAGGNLICTYKSGFADEFLKIYAATQPHIINKCLGIHYDEFTLPKNVGINYNGKHGEASMWMEMVEPDTAQVMAAYDHPVWKRFAAATFNTYGKGHAMYLSTYFDRSLLEGMLRDFFSMTHYYEPDKIFVGAAYPLVVKQGINEFGNQIVYLLNYSDRTQTVTLPDRTGQELISGNVLAAGSRISVEEWGVKVIEYM